MAGPTLGQAQARALPSLVTGIINSMRRVAPVLQYLPVYTVSGTKIEFNQILAFGNVQWGSACPAMQ